MAAVTPASEVCPGHVEHLPGSGLRCNRRVPPRTWAGRENQVPDACLRNRSAGDQSPTHTPLMPPQCWAANLMHFKVLFVGDWSAAELFLRHWSGWSRSLAGPAVYQACVLIFGLDQFHSGCWWEGPRCLRRWSSGRPPASQTKTKGRPSTNEQQIENKNK